MFHQRFTIITLCAASIELLGCRVPQGGCQDGGVDLGGTDGSTSCGVSASSSGSSSSDCSTSDCSTSSTSSTSTTSTSSATTDPTTSTTTPSTTGPGTSTGDDPVCGNGTMENGEECDHGPDNADDAACTAGCKIAVCGDELIQKDVEVCDNGVNDGLYGGCAIDCKALAPHCGDNILDVGHEECDGDAACLTGMCKYAKSCLDYKQADPLSPSGIYSIHRNIPVDPVQVYCEMKDSVDGGGYTFLKVDVQSDNNADPAFAPEAEEKCGEYGMQLLIPRTMAHLTAAYTVAITENVAPVGGGTLKSDSSYLRILGIYPKVPNVSCVDKAINSVDCPEWIASDSKVYWISAKGKMGSGQPDTDGACSGCSMSYTWNGDGTVKNYVAVADTGGSSFRFMCDTGDKLP